MFRLIVLLLFGLGAAAPSFAADYEINLSVLDTLSLSDAETEPPLPIIESKAVPAKKTQPHKALSLKVKKSVEPVIKTQPETAVIKPATENLEVKAEENNQPTVKEEQEPATVSTPVKDNVPQAVSFSPNTENAPQEEKAVSVKTADHVIEEAVTTSDEPAAVMSTKTPDISENAANVSVSSLSNRTALLVFDEESADLNAGIVDILMKMAEGLETENVGKITIEAYNYDDGAGSFTRKRLSLNRAVAVRSWLLNKGFKSFGVKIINTGDYLLRNNIQLSF